MASEIEPTGLLAQEADVERKTTDRYLSGNPVRVYGSGVISAKLYGEDIRQVAVELPSDGGIELPMAKKQPDPFGGIRLTGAEIGLMILANSIDATTPLDYDYSGFVIGNDEWVGSIVLDGYRDEQGGVPNTVSVGAKPATGPLSVAGSKDGVSGAWTAIDLRAASHETTPKIGSCTMKAEGLSSCEFTINGEPVNLDRTVDRLEVGIVASELVGITVYQDSSVAFVEVDIDGVARSVRLDNIERIESVLTKVLSGPWYKTGLLGVAAAFVLFVGGVVVKQAVETLVEAWLPKKG